MSAAPRAGSPWLGVEQIVSVTGGRLLTPVPDGDLRFTACAIDSRSLEGGELFVPLPGTRTDGHAFVEAALRGGAAGSLVQAGRERDPAWTRLSKPVIEVHDPLAALQALGRYCRERSGARVVAVTGSNGKTTTKEMTAAVLGTALSVHKNVGNLNNHIGVPLTLSRLTPGHQALVLELGMSARGEIRFLTGLCRPEVGILTIASAAHLEQLGSVEEIALAKSELAEAVPPDGLLVLNADDPLLWPMNRNRPTAVRSYALDNEEADLRPTRLVMTASGGARFRLPDGTEVSLSLLGRHNARNALAAILVGDWFGIPRVDAARALATLRPAKHRLQLLQSASGVSVLDDCYNANPASMREALGLLGSIETGGARRAVLGDMLELGPRAAELHEEVGRAVPESAWLYLAGEQAAALERGARAAGVEPSRIRRFPDVPAMVEAVVADSKRGDLVLVKASRGMRLERVVDALLPATHAAPADPARAGRS